MECFSNIFLVCKWWKYFLFQFCYLSLLELTKRENQTLIRLPEVIVEWGQGKKIQLDLSSGQSVLIESVQAQAVNNIN